MVYFRHHSVKNWPNGDLESSAKMAHTTKSKLHTLLANQNSKRYNYLYSISEFIWT